MTGLSAGSLWRAVIERSRCALEIGALEPIDTEPTTVDDGGVRFVVRVARNLRKKATHRQPAAGHRTPPVNPFLPYDEDLHVADICDSHVALLNKFNVVAHHLLIVTRTFEEQASALTLRDFEALSICMAEYRALAFYNSGEVAGASQRHRHLQMVPLPLAADSGGCPIDARLGGVESTATAISVPGLPFSHRFLTLAPAAAEYQHADAARRFTSYLALLDAAGVRLPAPYNLLLTRDWMMLIPRTREHCHGISINALGFAGSLFVKTGDELALVRRLGPMTILRGVTR